MNANVNVKEIVNVNEKAIVNVNLNEIVIVSINKSLNVNGKENETIEQNLLTSMELAQRMVLDQIFALLVVVDLDVVVVVSRKTMNVYCLRLKKKIRLDQFVDVMNFLILKSD